MEQLRKNLRPLAPLFLRLGLGFVFLLFAYHKLAVSEQGRVEIQGILDFVGIGAASAIHYYLGIAELLIALSFIFGWQVRWFGLLATALVSGFFGSIVLKFGLTNDPNLYRDIGLAGGAFALWLMGAGPMSFDARKDRTTIPPETTPQA